MPIYLYHCDSCNVETEIEQKITEEPIAICPKCAQPTLKRIPPRDISIQFKGSGFYKTDYTSSKDTKGDNPPHGCSRGNCGCGK